MQDLSRLNVLIDKAANAAGGSDNKLATMLGTSRQVVSNWRHGQKEPAIEKQIEMAKIAGIDPAPIVIAAAVEKTGHEGALALVRQLGKSIKGGEWLFT
jgi:ribosome-binding protein aMBF1 (putative translation factor)